MRTLELIEKVNKLDTPIQARFTTDREYIRFNVPYKNPFYKIRVGATTLLSGNTQTNEMNNDLVMNHLFKLLELVMEYVETPSHLKEEPKFRLRLTAPLLSHEKIETQSNNNLYLMYSPKRMGYIVDYLYGSINQSEFSDQDIDGLDLTGFEKEPI